MEYPELNFQLMVESAPYAIILVSRACKIAFINDQTEKLFGYHRHELMGQSIEILISKRYRDQHSDLRGMLSGLPASRLSYATREFFAVRKDGTEFGVEIKLSSVTATTGAYVLASVTDITELIEYRQNLEAKVQERTRELNEALYKEKELVEMKSKFISIASHEFRTPLSTISLIAGILRKHKEKISTEEFNARIDSIEKQVRHMTYMLDDILTIGKADAGKIQTQYTSIPIENFFEQTAAEVEQSTNTHKIKRQIKCSVKKINLDEKLLRNIVLNLLTNAIKFSPQSKSVSLTVTNTADTLIIKVRDKGIGILEEDRTKLFTSFHRGSNVGTIQGTGLGLSIVKKAVDLLKGEIQLHSEIDRGTVFTITLPFLKSGIRKKAATEQSLIHS
jgi:PAS domain S-box-containing protein